MKRTFRLARKNRQDRSVKLEFESETKGDGRTVIPSLADKERSERT